MVEEVIVTGKGQTTMPVKLRAKHKIRRGTKLEVTGTKEGRLLKPKPMVTDKSGIHWMVNITSQQTQ
ncbi:MAG: AbrB/MazE/SpoVT family DNA-binding domain-containing protein [Thaumarchaeota archaeon]|nr:AbrB/MazE/SpoVT family DNA-binding domain-containing protein [Nitrososphaerota archaeon]